MDQDIVFSSLCTSRHVAIASLVALTSALSGGCAWRHPTNRTYAPGFEPIRATMESPIPSDGAQAPNIKSGQDGSVFWADARMIAHAPASAVCDALRRPEVVVNDGAIDSWRETPLDPSTLPEGVTGFVLENTVHRVATIKFQITWQIAESEEDEGCVARWDLTRAPAFIAKNRGWISIEELDRGLTLIEAQAELDAPRVNESVPHGYLERLVEKIVRASLVE